MKHRDGGIYKIKTVIPEDVGMLDMASVHKESMIRRLPISTIVPVSKEERTLRRVKEQSLRSCLVLPITPED